MCGITGFIGRGDRGDLRRMMTAMIHRGPDADGEFCDEKRALYLGHRRLSILDHQGGLQPFSTEDGQLTIVYNGEIYNHLSLRRELEALGHQFRSDHSDTETLLIAYRQWGLAMQERLNGMWAFAIYDAEKREVFCSRDRFGQKPFYYAVYPQGFAFASELTALLEHPAIPRDQDDRAIRKYYAHGYFPGANTPFKAIRKLPAGASLVVSVETPIPKINTWWRFLLEPQPLFSTEQAWCEALLEKLEIAVKRRLMADVPLGVLLSGGLDSSSMAYFANRHQAQPINSFAMGFESPSFDERRFALHAANAIGTKHHQTQLTWVDAVASMATIVHRLDEPLGDSSLIPTAHLCQFARKQVTVALGGDGADELFAGYDPFLALKKAKWYDTLVPKPIHQAISLVASRLPVSQTNMSLGFKINKTLEGLSVRRPLWIPTWMAPLTRTDLETLFSQPVDLEDLYEEAIQAWTEEPAEDLLSQTLQFFTRLYLTDSILCKVDRASMMHSLEVRAPFLDIDLVNLVRRMPHQLKFRGQTTKYILKKAMTGLLPDSIINRKKKGFGMPIGAWLAENRINFPLNRPSFSHHYPHAQALHQQHVSAKKDQRLFLWSYWVHREIHAKRFQESQF